MKHTPFNFKTSDGLELFGRVWRAQTDPAKGIVNLVHGVGEHSGRYAHVAETLTKAGYHLAAFDLRGHGLSEGKRGHAPSFDQLLDDVTVFLQESQTRLGADLPVFLYGHSLGGLIVIDYGLRRSSSLSGIISTGPALALAFEPPKFKLFIGKAMANLAPSFTMNNALDVNALSRDAAIVKAYQDDALVHDRISAKLVMDMFDAGKYDLEHAAEWQIPLLLMHGTEDHISSAAASRQFKTSADGKVDLVLWESYFHEIHNDIGKEPVLETMVNWLDEHIQ